MFNDPGNCASPKMPPTAHAMAELEYLAFHGNHAEVRARYMMLSEQDRPAFQSVSVLSAVFLGALKSGEGAGDPLFPYPAIVINGDRTSVERDLAVLIEFCRTRNLRPRELYHCLLTWSEVLSGIASVDEALGFLDMAMELGAGTHPEILYRIVLGRASLLYKAGRLQEAHTVLADMVERYYLVPDKNTITSAVFLLGRTSLLTGQAAYYKQLLLSGLRFFFTSAGLRRLFTRQLTKTYRRFYRVLLDHDLSLADKVLYLVHGMDAFVDSSRIFRIIGIASLTRTAVLAYVYALNYVFLRSRPPRAAFPSRAARRASVGTGARTAILVTRAMGGIGDLLMMTPGLHALKELHPESEIHLALPRRFHELFAGNSDIVTKDIESKELDITSYRTWINLTDCPAVRYESRTAPQVRQGRIEIFARALGIKGKRLRSMENRPRYFITEEEKAFQEAFWKDHGLYDRIVVGVQLQAAEPYRDYPRMEDLVNELAGEYAVVLFHGEGTTICSGGTIIDPGMISLRQAFALAAGCQAIIAPDSAFVHFAAALDIPCIALYGPIDGRVRTRDYPLCTSLDAGGALPCVPCWRNEVIPCRLTDMRNSACMGNISIDTISRSLKNSLRKSA